MKFLQMVLLLVVIFMCSAIVDVYAQGININFGTNPRVHDLYNVGNSPGSDGEVIGLRVDKNFCVKSAGDAIYFDIENAILFERASFTKNLINVEYYDVSEREIKLIYDSQTDVDKECAESIVTTGTNTWKSKSFFLDDAFFGDRQKNGADFRLVCADTMFIDIVRVVPIDYYIDYGTENEEYLIYHIPGGDSQTEIIAPMGEECITTIVEHNYIYCNVDDDELFNGDIPDFYISVEYFDSSATMQMRLQYDAFDEEFKSLEWASGRGWGTFKTYTWEIEDGYMSNRENGGADFRINLEEPGMPINRIMLGFLDYGMPSQVKTKPVSVSTFNLEQNYPNPFNPSTTIRYSLTQQGEASLAIYNVQGERIRTIVDQVQSAGDYTCEWNGMDADGNMVASGLYVYKLQVEGETLTRKMTLLK